MTGYASVDTVMGGTASTGSPSPNHSRISSDQSEADIPYTQRYARYAHKIRFLTRQTSADRPPTIEENLLEGDARMTHYMWLDTNHALILPLVGFVITARITSISRGRVELDVRDHNETIKAHDITMKLTLPGAAGLSRQGSLNLSGGGSTPTSSNDLNAALLSSPQPTSRPPSLTHSSSSGTLNVRANRGRYCQWILGVHEFSKSGASVLVSVTQTHIERPWIRAVATLPKMEFNTDGSPSTPHQLSLMKSPWVAAEITPPAPDVKGGMPTKILMLATIRDANTLHITALPADNDSQPNVPGKPIKLWCTELRFEKLQYARWFGLRIMVTAKDQSPDDDRITFNISPAKEMISFEFGRPFDVPFDCHARLQQESDYTSPSGRKMSVTETYNAKPLRIDIMDIPNAESVVVKVSRQIMGTPMADAIGDWRIAVLQKEIPKHVVLSADDEAELRVTLVALQHYSIEPTSQPPIATLLVEDASAIRKLTEREAHEQKAGRVMTEAELAEYKARHSGRGDRDSAKKDLELKGYISSALGDLS